MKRNQDPINRFIWERRKREKDMKEEVNRKEKIKPWEKRREKNPNKEMKNYNSKKEDLEEEDQGEDERNVIL